MLLEVCIFESLIKLARAHCLNQSLKFTRMFRGHSENTYYSRHSTNSLIKMYFGFLIRIRVEMRFPSWIIFKLTPPKSFLMEFPGHAASNLREHWMCAIWFTYLNIFIGFKSIGFVIQIMRVKPLKQRVVQTKSHFWISEITESSGQFI